MKFYITFKTAVVGVIVEAKNEKKAREMAWEEYDLNMTQMLDEGRSEVEIKEVRPIHNPK